MLVATNLSLDEETRRIFEERAAAVGLSGSSYRRIMARRTRNAPRSRAAAPIGIDRPRAADDHEPRTEGVSRNDRPRIVSERGGGEDVFRRRRLDRDASPFDRPIIGRALRAMMDELTARVPRGNGEEGLPHPGSVRRGRPPVVTPEIAARILDLQGAGLGYKRIARATGISVTTVRRVLRKKAEAE